MSSQSAEQKQEEFPQNTVESSPPKRNFDVYLCHRQDSGGLHALALKYLLVAADPMLDVFLDFDHSETINNLEEDIMNSQLFILVLTERKR